MTVHFIAISEETAVPSLRHRFAAPPLPHFVGERKGAKPSTQAPFLSPNSVGGEVAPQSGDGVGDADPEETTPDETPSPCISAALGRPGRRAACSRPGWC